MSRTEGKLDRLPQWARERIEVLERQNQELRVQVSRRTLEYQTHLGVGLNTAAGSASAAFGLPEYYLPDSERIRYLLGADKWKEGESYDREVSVTLEGNLIRIHSSGRGLLVSPVSAGEIVLQLGSRHGLSGAVSDPQEGGIPDAV